MVKFRNIPISEARTGVVLISPIYDFKGSKLLGAGVELTDLLVKRLKQRGIHNVLIDERDLLRRNGIASHRRRSPQNQRHLQLPSLPLAEANQRHRTTPYNTETLVRLTEEHEHRLANFMPFVSALAAERRVNTDTVRSVSSQSLFSLAEDIDLFTYLATKPSLDAYPGGHSFSGAMLAMSIGATLGLDEATLIELSTGCLLHDVGMFKVDKSIYESPAELSSSELAEIAKHPSKTLDMLQQNCEGIPEASLMVARQTHERCNGSGYPDGKSAAEIHDLAKIAAVADAFTAMVSPRAYRDALLPHNAVKTLLGEAENGLYDGDVVHALLDTVSGYPIGSFVELSDHRIAQVIRAKPGNWISPDVQIWNGGSVDDDPVVLDLADEPNLNILRPIAERVASYGQVHLDAYG